MALDGTTWFEVPERNVMSAIRNASNKSEACAIVLATQLPSLFLQLGKHVRRGVPDFIIAHKAIKDGIPTEVVDIMVNAAIHIRSQLKTK